LSSLRALYLITVAGMGDMLMVMAAAKALKAHFNCAVFLCTRSEYLTLAKAGRHVDDAFSNWQTLNKAIAPYPPGTVLGVNLEVFSLSISQSHQVDAFLANFDIEAPPHLKELELRRDASSDAQVERLIGSWPALAPGQRRILVHPALSDPHRTWPGARWEELCSRLIAAGHQVVVIGVRVPETGRSMHELSVPGLVSAADQLDALGTVALMRRADLLVSTDSGPIQLAAATDIGIVGIYSIVAATNRLPFRHGKAGWNAKGVVPVCSAHPCFEKLRDPVLKERALREGPGGRHPLGEWCMMPERYHCMTHEITVSMVLDTCRDLMTEWQARRQ
jgi:ADP-heptose:LPS heptosyltransferase